MATGGDSDSTRTDPAAPASGTSRVLNKLAASLKSGNYYEAHQMYRTLYFRYSGQRKYRELEDLMYDGAQKLFSYGQDASGSDMAKLYLETLEKGHGSNASSGESNSAGQGENSNRREEMTMQRIARLYSLIPAALPDKETFRVQAVAWSRAGNKYPTGHPKLHQLLAHELWKYKRYAESQRHFLNSMDGSGLGQMLVEFHMANGFPSEVDLFVAETVFQMLCIRKHIVAAIAFKAYTENHPAINRGPPYKYPLLNFVWLLLLAIEHKHSSQAFYVLLDKYKPSFSRDPCYVDYLDKIGQQFFGLAPLRPPQQRARPAGGMFSGLMDSIMSVLNDEDDNSNAGLPWGGPRPSTSTASAGTSASSGPAGRPSSSTGPSSSRNMLTEDLD